MFAIGDKEWPGISKLVEEAGEVVQVGGKLMGTRGASLHWDGTHLGERLADEMGELMAAIEFVAKHNFDSAAMNRFVQRYKMKLELYEQWHRENPAPPKPADLWDGEF